MSCTDTQLLAMVAWLGAVIVIGMLLVFMSWSFQRKVRTIDMLIADLRLASATLAVERRRK